MEIKLSKSAQKVYSKSSPAMQNHFDGCLKKIQDGTAKVEKAIPINNKKNMDNLYRLKMEHYRILFTKTEDGIVVKEILTKTNVKFRKHGFM